MRAAKATRMTGRSNQFEGCEGRDAFPEAVWQRL
jgi:hypothetical protein